MMSQFTWGYEKKIWGTVDGTYRWSVGTKRVPARRRVPDRAGKFLSVGSVSTPGGQHPNHLQEVTGGACAGCVGCESVSVVGEVEREA